MPCDFADGLSEVDLQRAEGRYGFRFPPDLRALLGSALPVGDRFPDWRDPEAVQDQMTWPWHGLAFDIEQNDIWPKDWGERPPELREQLIRARSWFDDAPVLIPICGHRYVCAEPNASGNPVLSVYQTDIIYYGSNLENWIRREFFRLEQLGDPLAKPPCWSDAMNWWD